MQQILSYIDDNLGEKIGLTQMANVLDMSPYYFCRLFRNSTGVSPYHYVIQQRVRRAQQLLGQRLDLSITDIALECGFANQSHMAKHFRKLTGTTPKAYRSQ